MQTMPNTEEEHGGDLTERRLHGISLFAVGHGDRALQLQWSNFVDKGLSTHDHYQRSPGHRHQDIVHWSTASTNRMTTLDAINRGYVCLHKDGDGGPVVVVRTL